MGVGGSGCAMEELLMPHPLFLNFGLPMLYAEELSGFADLDMYVDGREIPRCRLIPFYCMGKNNPTAKIMI